VGNMKRRALLLAILLGLNLFLSGCEPAADDMGEDDRVWLDMNTEYKQPTTLPDGGGQRVKVVLLLGQSNATGVALNSYLEKQLETQDYDAYINGFPAVLINYCLDNHEASSDGEFVKVDMTCGMDEGHFGPELGMAEVLAEEYENETVVILKYTMSGYSLSSHWLSQGERGSIYEAFLKFTKTYMDALRTSNYDARIGAICWMQGESDAADGMAELYYDNQTRFVSFLREDLSGYEEEGGIYFIDAGIYDAPICQPDYLIVNKAKTEFNKTSPLNMYFSTIDEKLTFHLEPEEEPDLVHYDSMSVLKLGHLFGEHVVQSYKMRNETVLNSLK